MKRLHIHPIPFLSMILLIVGTDLPAFSQSRWQETIGGSASDAAYAMAKTADGGYVLAGSTQSFGAGESDMYVLKVDAVGAIQWTRTIGGGSDDVAFCVIQTSDNGYAVAGRTSSFGNGGYDVYIVKLSASGTVEWSKTIGGTGSEWMNSIVQNADGGFTLAGTTTSFGPWPYNIYLVRVDAAGDLLWNETIGGTGGGIGWSLIRTIDGGYALAAHSMTTANSSIDYCIVKLTANGTPTWWTIVGGAAHDYPKSIIQTSDGGFAAAGYCQGFGAGASDLYVVKLTSGGALQWTRTVGGTGSEGGYSIIQTPSDAGYTIGGYTSSSGTGGADLYLVHLNASGSYQWSKYANVRLRDACATIVQTADGGYTAGGYGGNNFDQSDSDVCLTRFNSSGSSCGDSRSMKSKSGTGGTAQFETPTVTYPSPVVTSQSSLVSSGGTLVQLCYRPKTSFDSDLVEADGEAAPRINTLEQNHPNPFNPSTTIEYSLMEDGFVSLNVFDALGRIVASVVNTYQNAGSYVVSFDARSLPSGLYTYTLSVGGAHLSRTMTLMK